jgi:hypothetical protein
MYRRRASPPKPRQQLPVAYDYTPREASVWDTNVQVDVAAARALDGDRRADVLDIDSMKKQSAAASKKQARRGRRAEAKPDADADVAGVNPNEVEIV